MICEECGLEIREKEARIAIPGFVRHTSHRTCIERLKFERDRYKAFAAGRRADDLCWITDISELEAARSISREDFLESCGKYRSELEAAPFGEALATVPHCMTMARLIARVIELEELHEQAQGT
jgi:hypothetical protein